MAWLGCERDDENVWMDMKLPSVAVCSQPLERQMFSADRLTVGVTIVVERHPADVRSLDNPVGPETKLEGSYCQGPV